MKAYTAQEWQLKFKEQAGKNKQLQHDLSCTALVKEVDAQKEIDTLIAKVLEGIKLIDEWKQLNDDYHAELTKAEAKIVATNKKVGEIQLEAVLESMIAIYEGSAEWNKGYKAGAADMIIKIQKELSPILFPRKEEAKTP